MATLEHASLTEVERDALERAVVALGDELGAELLAVWLYGSRARGEPPREGSDIDLMVVVSRDASFRRWQSVSHLVREAVEPTGVNPWTLSLTLRSREWIADRRAVESFFVRDLDRDRVVLHGAPGGELPGVVPLTESARRRHADGRDGVKPRSREELEKARERLEEVDRLVAYDFGTAIVVSSAYHAMLHAARAALSEEELERRTHSSTWSLFGETFVLSGRFEAELASRGAAYRHLRERAEYNLWDPDVETARTVVLDARRFVTAVARLLEG